MFKKLSLLILVLFLVSCGQNTKSDYDTFVHAFANNKSDVSLITTFMNNGHLEEKIKLTYDNDEYTFIANEICNVEDILETLEKHKTELNNLRSNYVELLNNIELTQIDSEIYFDEPLMILEVYIGSKPSTVSIYNDTLVLKYNDNITTYKMNNASGDDFLELFSQYLDNYLHNSSNSPCWIDWTFLD